MINQKLANRKLTKNTIRPVLRWLDAWPGSIYSLNTSGDKFYHFTLDYYNGKPSWQGGFAYDLGGCFDYNGESYGEYALDMATGDVIRLSDQKTVFNINTIKIRG